MATRGYTAEAEVRDLFKHGFGCKTFKPVWSMFGEKDVYGIADFIAHFPLSHPDRPGIQTYVQVKNISRGGHGEGHDGYLKKLREFAEVYLNEKECVELWIKREPLVKIPELHYEVTTISRDSLTGSLKEAERVVPLKLIKSVVGEKVNARRKPVVKNPPRGIVPVLSVQG
ncbi:MAG: hypothetical protein WCW93_03815 [Candidatus Paceibacterota bacterium]|jgi:hypothetical protein